MGSESIAHQVEGHESERNNSFSKIQLVGQMLSQCTQIAQASAKAATLKSSALQSCYRACQIPITSRSLYF